MKLTIGMCTHDDFDGVWFTIQSILMYHPEVRDDIKFVVVDSNPDQPHGQAVERLIGKLTNKHGNCGLYVKNTTWKSTASRNYVFQFAETPYVLCLDSHVMLAPGSIKKLIEYYDKNPETKNLYHGPLIDDNQQPFANHMKASWKYNMYGEWINHLPWNDKKSPYEIPMMGLGLFSCIKKNWLGFNENFKGFGGEEGYIHRKYKKHGYKTMILPWLKWLHRFERPNGVPYAPEYIDRIRNYFIGWAENGDDPQEIIDYYSKPNTIPGQEREALTGSVLRQIQAECEQLVNTGEQLTGAIQPTTENTLAEENNKLKDQLKDLQAQIDALAKR